MSHGLTQNPPDAFARLSAGLEEYRRVSGRTSSAILVQKGAQLLHGNSNPKYGATFPGLVDLFLDEVPEQGSIWEAARARGFRVGRKILGGQLSERAETKARAMMGGFKYIIASLNPHTGRLRFVRSGKRKSRVYYRPGRESFPAGGDFSGPLANGDRRMNIRAVATFFELAIRSGGRRFLAASFLHRRWRKLAQSDPRRAPGTWRLLVNQNPRSTIQPLGEAQLAGSEESGNLELRITSYVPGVREVGTKRGLFVRAIEGVRRDIDAYLARKQREELEASLRKHLGAAAPLAGL